ncbi:MAG: GntR family transcriptional regulator [Ardenticatenaceae bacterium]|nr:GntR family transcriptional regulator [Ardenticatenaceae bacterium]
MLIQRPKPLSEQVTAILRQRIIDHVYPPGGRLPSESELAQELGVSRATIRTVLAKFANEGLILRKQGDGTYVNERLQDIDSRYGGLWDFSRLIEANGYQPAIRTILVEQRPSAPQEAQALHLTHNTPVLSLVRLFLADERPVILAKNVLSIELIKTDVSEVDGKLPIYQLLQRYCHEQIAYAITDIEPTLPDNGLNDQLERTTANPLLKLTETFYNKDNYPLVFGLSYYDQTMMRLRLVQAWG